MTDKELLELEGVTEETLKNFEDCKGDKEDDR
jgi:hypothetical protein